MMLKGINRILKLTESDSCLMMILGCVGFGPQRFISQSPGQKECKVCFPICTDSVGTNSSPKRVLISLPNYWSKFIGRFAKFLKSLIELSKRRQNSGETYLNVIRYHLQF